MTRWFPAVALALWAVACGGPNDTRPVASSPASAGATTLAGLHVSDLARAMRERGLTCQAPRQERETMHWVCEASTPLLGYHTEFYGKAPGRLEYLRVVVTQAGLPRRGQTLSMLSYFAGLGYQGAEPDKARAWIDKTLDQGGQEMFGPAKFKISGDLSRLVLEIKAPGSDW